MEYDSNSNWIEKMNLGIPENDPFRKWVNRIAAVTIFTFLIYQLLNQ